MTVFLMASKRSPVERNFGSEESQSTNSSTSLSESVSARRTEKVVMYSGCDFQRTVLIADYERGRTTEPIPEMPV